MITHSRFSAGEQPDLLPQHQKLLDDSGISSEVQRQRGYRSVHDFGELLKLEFARSQCITPCLLIPIHGVGGGIVLHQIRPDAPRTHGGQIAKYEVPAGSTLRLDVPPTCRQYLNDVSVPLVVTDGVRQADSGASKGLCCVAVLKQGRNIGSKADGKLGSLPDWGQIALANRAVFIVFSLQVMADPRHRKALVSFKKSLVKRGATVQFIVLPGKEGRETTGLDDYLAAGHTANDLFALATDDLPLPSVNSLAPNYYEQDGHLCRKTKDGEVVLLTNFSARITVDMLVTDGDTKVREFEISANVNGRTEQFDVSADEFDRMVWVLPKLGPNAIIYPGYGAEKHAKVAIQAISTNISRQIVHTHTGWIKHHGTWGYLHAGGMITAAAGSTRDGASVNGQHDEDHRKLDTGPTGLKDSSINNGAVLIPGKNVTGENTAASNDHGSPGTGAVKLGPAVNARKDQSGKALEPGGPLGPHSEDKGSEYVRVRLPEKLSGYNLPTPPTGRQRKKAVRRSLRLLQLGPDYVAFPMIAAIGRAVLGDANFCLWLAGLSGILKSVWAGLGQQFYGAAMNYEHLPASWQSTANANRTLAFLIKDAVLVVDDFVLKGTGGDIQKAQKEVDDLLRDQRNRSGRDRARGDGSLNPGKAPRGLIISTGEALPVGYSLNARIFSIEMKREDSPLKTDKALLDRCQADADHGYYAQAKSAYIQRLAANLDGVRASARAKAAEVRSQWASKCRHPHTATIVGELTVGFGFYVAFTLAIGAISVARFTELMGRFNDVMAELVRRQNQQLVENDPAEQYLLYLSNALSSGAAHVANIDGGQPALNPRRWGWDVRTFVVVKEESTTKDDADNQQGRTSRSETEEQTNSGDGSVTEGDADNPKTEDDADKRGSTNRGEREEEQINSGDVSQSEGGAGNPKGRTDQSDAEEKEKSSGDGAGPKYEEHETLHAKGRRIGWVRGDDLFLLPGESLAIVQDLARRLGSHLPITLQTLGPLLYDKGLIVYREEGRGKYTRRQSIEGKRQIVYHLNANKVVPGSNEPNPSDPYCDDPEWLPELEA